MEYEEFWQPLLTVYPAAEARAIARMVLEVRYGLSWADVLVGRTAQLPACELQQLQQRLLTGEPPQYVLGEAEFGGRRFAVERGVLIPRPETLELCQWVLSDMANRPSPALLDVGTGSGCIACTLAVEMPQARIEAWDVSPVALRVAAENAKRLGASVSVRRQDALQPPADPPQWDAVVSNPPYICQHERATMEPNVLDHEPALALFVPDDDPLLFYRHIARYAAQALLPGGHLYFEINPLQAQPLVAMLQQMGFGNVETKNDDYGKCRFTKACKPTAR